MNSKEQEMLRKHKQRSENGFNALQKYVIEQKPTTIVAPNLLSKL
jgi:hypothetical protein